MTVKELREKLARLDEKTDVFVLWEDGSQQHILGIDDVSIGRGTPKRHPNGKVGFKWEASGPAAWVFISVSEE